MSEEGKHQYFIQTFIAVSAAHQSLADAFFVRRLNQKLSEFAQTYLNLIAAENVAQSRARGEHIHATVSLAELLEELRHLKLGKAIPLSLGQVRLLNYRLLLMREKISLAPLKAVSAEEEKKPATSKAPVLTVTAEKIVNFVRKSAKVRTKDIITEFSALSERTVKRNLQELTQKGVLKKMVSNRAMYYLVN